MSAAADTEEKVENKSTLTPPASEEADKHGESSSELSDLELDGDDNGEILPDHYYDGGKIPVFKPTMDQFRSFKNFINKIDKYGMKSGIIKVIPPKEWSRALPALDEQVKTIKVKNPITQEFHGTHGTYTQANIEKQRSYSLPQWKALTEESNHQPPARRGERRRNQERAPRGGTPRTAKNEAAILADGKKRGPGRPRIRPHAATAHKAEAPEAAKLEAQIPSTPGSPAVRAVRGLKSKKEASITDEDGSPRPKGRQPKSVSSRRKHNSRDQADTVDEEAFKDFDYRVHNQSEWTAERCQELETAYWKSLTFNNPMYGADMPGSLFDDTTESWNVAKLENLLDVLGQKVPGVNTAYLYLGMWKATFAWHLEDVDLYSINYIHFGAPKQWYSISQEDARRFEAAMRNVWPNDAKNCDQFLRHKTYLISPQLLQSQYNIKVNRLVHNEGEFVITFPYGYHSGYNLGYNCAESVNLATEAWLDYGRVAKKCNCEADSVWIDVEDIERRLRGEQTPEYYEETEEEEEEDDDDDGPTDLPTPPGSDKGKPKPRSHKRKRDTNDKETKPKVKRVRIKIRVPSNEPCILCPNDNSFEELLPTDNGLKAHRRCGLYTPETYFAELEGVETICDVGRIDKARLELKCNHCRNKRGAVFQCSQKKCTRAYHATCGASAGVQIDMGIIPVYGEDGTEYTDTGIDFRCRFHRIRRPKYADKDTCSAALEDSSLIRKYATKLPRGEVVQVQFYQSDIFAGAVLENRKSEQTLLLEVLPKGDEVEVEYKWLLVFDPATSQLPVPSENAIPLPAHLTRKSRTTTEDPSSDIPKPDEPFCDVAGPYKHSEFHAVKLPINPVQAKVDMDKAETWWHYIGKTSTEAKAQYTADINNMVNNPSANFLESVRPPVVLPPPTVRRSMPASYPSNSNVGINPGNLGRMASQPQTQARQLVRPPPKAQDRPYNGKYAIKEPIPNKFAPQGCKIDTQSFQNQSGFVYSASLQSRQNQGFQAPQAPMRSFDSSLPTMADVQRRASNTQSANMNYRLITPATYPQHPPQQMPPLQSPSTPQAAVANMAPIANMSGTASSSLRNPFSRPGSSHQSPQATTPEIQTRPRSDSMAVISNYPYLREAAANRPAVYKSPYAPGGGFTEVAEAWLPKQFASKIRRPRTMSISEDFLKHRTQSQREAVKGHIRKISTDKAMAQFVEQQQRQLAQKQRNVMPPPQANHLHQQHIPPQMVPDFLSHEFSPAHLYSRSPTFPDFGQSFNSPTPSYSDLVHPPHTFSDDHPFQPPDLQFSSPQDFQLQMQRESHSQSQVLIKEEPAYDTFLQGLRHPAHPHPHGHGGQDVVHGSSSDGTSGSPLRQGMRGAGGEMLPMMQDRYLN